MTSVRGVVPFVSLLAAASSLGCSADDVRLGRFSVKWEGSDPTIFITHDDGFEISTAKRAFEASAFSAASEMQFGSFKFEESVTRSPVVATGISDWDEGEGLVDATLEADGESLGTLAIRARGDALSLRFEAGEAYNRASIRFECDEGPFLGFGAQTHDTDQRGQRVPIFVSEQGIGKVDSDEQPEVWFLVGTRHQSYVSVPTTVALRGRASYGLHATTFRRSAFDLCGADPDALEITVDERAGEVLIFPGPSPAGVLEQLTSVVGRPPPVPDWTYGVWMERVGGTAAVLAEAEKLRAENIPASAIWSEDWRGGRSSGDEYILEEDWRADPELYPDLSEMISTLGKGGFRFMTYFNTFVVNGVDVDREARDRGLLVEDPRGSPIEFQAPSFEDSSLLDLLQPEGREFALSELSDALALGVRGWMADYAEWYPVDPRSVKPSDGSDPEVAHHRYPVSWAEVNRDALASYPDAVVFLRSGYTGSQAAAPVIWAGDQRTSFDADDGLPTVVPILLGLSMTGFPVVTHDIGGYVSATNPPTTKELFFRWTTLGAFSPVMRTHHGRSADLNWRWDSDAATIAHFRRWAEVHTRLFPLWKGLAREARERGTPILRPLLYRDPGNRSLDAVKDAFLVGDGLLVAPVVTSSTTERAVVLPAGGWYELSWGAEGPATKRFVEQGETSVEVPLGEIATFAAAGAVLPLIPAGVETLVTGSERVGLESLGSKRVVYTWLGAAGRAPEGAFGSHVLSSPRRPTQITSVEGGEFTIEGTTATIRSAEQLVRLTDEAGTVHELRREGAAGELTVDVVVSW
ncbi:MAG: hypothetical protein HY791_39100 [Deltaproteobacteria bacterium]|nr:hypothetical protein [Deltaproteobacteria bacterium]